MQLSGCDRRWKQQSETLDQLDRDIFTTTKHATNRAATSREQCETTAALAV
jgi:hypothetical protein